MKQILVIDDCKLTCTLLTSTLDSPHWRVRAENDPFSGLRWAKQSRPDLILLDLDMPGMNGVACLAAIRADTGIRHTPVIMISASPLKELILKVAKHGVQGIVLKNGSFAASLLARVQSLFHPDRTSGLSAAPPRSLRVPEKSPGAITTGTPPLMNTGTGGCEVPSQRSAAALPTADSQDAAEIEGEGDFVLDEEWRGASLGQALAELRGMRPLLTRSALEKHVNDASELRALGPAAQRVISLTGSSSSTTDEIARAIRQDQALSLKLLKLANSSLYGSGGRVDAVAKAVSRIGISQIHQSVMSMAVMDELGGPGLTGRIQTDQFWEHSVATALIASRVIRLRGGTPELADTFFTAGLLHDVGRMLFATHLGGVYDQVLEISGNLGLPVETVESRLLLTNHAEVTDRLLRRWKFPLEMIQPIAMHHLGLPAIRAAAPRMIVPISVLAFANRLAHSLLLGCSGNDAVYPVADFLPVLGLSGADVATLCDEVPLQTVDIKCAMLVHGTNAAPPQAFIDQARDALGDIGHLRPLRICTRAGEDAVGILADRLAGGSYEGTPNIAVLTVTGARDGAELVQRLTVAESDMALNPLPVLLVATTDAQLDSVSVPARPAARLLLPARLPRLLEALRALVPAEQPAR